MFLVDWTDGPSTHHSDQLEEGRYSQRDFKKSRMRREGEVVIGRFPKIEGSIGFLIGQRVRHFGRIRLGRWLEICFNKDCSIIPRSLASAEFVYHQTKHRHL